MLVVVTISPAAVPVLYRLSSWAAVGLSVRIAMRPPPPAQVEPYPTPLPPFALIRAAVPTAVKLEHVTHTEPPDPALAPLPLWFTPSAISLPSRRTARARMRSAPPPMPLAVCVLARPGEPGRKGACV
jgi:hypothetical protein